MEPDGLDQRACGREEWSAKAVVGRVGAASGQSGSNSFKWVAARCLMLGPKEFLRCIGLSWDSSLNHESRRLGWPEVALASFQAFCTALTLRRHQQRLGRRRGLKFTVMVEVGGPFHWGTVTSQGTFGYES